MKTSWLSLTGLPLVPRAKGRAPAADGPDWDRPDSVGVSAVALKTHADPSEARRRTFKQTLKEAS